VKVNLLLSKMQIIIKTKNLKLTDDLKNLIQNKISRLKKFISIFKEESSKEKKGKMLSEVFFEIEKETRHHKKGNIFRAEAVMRLPGRKLVAKTHNDDLKKTVVAVKDELEREIRKYKAQVIELPRRKYRKIKREILHKIE